jgi:hypothetical protein
MRTLTLAAATLLTLAAPAAQASITTFNFTGALQTFTTPSAGDYRITARGASGGGNPFINALGGLGAEAVGTFSLAASQTLSIVVGGQGGGPVL